MQPKTALLLLSRYHVIQASLDLSSGAKYTKIGTASSHLIPWHNTGKNQKKVNCYAYSAGIRDFSAFFVLMNVSIADIIHFQMRREASHER
jgi:hypothetical protein